MDVLSVYICLHTAQGHENSWVYSCELSSPSLELMPRLLQFRLAPTLAKQTETS